MQLPSAKTAVLVLPGHGSGSRQCSNLNVRYEALGGFRCLRSPIPNQ